MTADIDTREAGRLPAVPIARPRTDGRTEGGGDGDGDGRRAGSEAVPRASPKPTVSRGRRTARKRLIWGAVLAALILLVVWMMRPAPVAVETAVVARGPLSTSVQAEGVTRVRDRFQVAAPVSGRLERITLREGDAVAAGDVIARLTPLPLDVQAAAQATARVSAAQATRQEAEARVGQARAALEQTERTTARILEVAAVGGISVDAAERAELELAAARRELDAAASRVRAADAELAAARAALLDVDPTRATGRAVVEIRAPAAGRVLRVGEPSERIVAAGTPLVEIGDAAGLEAVVDVLSSDAVLIRPGATVALVEWGGDGEIAARVRQVEPSGFTKISTLGVEEQRVNVIVDLDAVPAGLGDGYRVEARIETWSAADVLTVPNGALFRHGTDWGVFVKEDGRARLRELRIGNRGTASAEVLQGLNESETVVLFPSDRVTEGARLKSQ
jgi:HlyD family secretion protein